MYLKLFGRFSLSLDLACSRLGYSPRSRYRATAPHLPHPYRKRLKDYRRSKSTLSVITSLVKYHPLFIICNSHRKVFFPLQSHRIDIWETRRSVRAQRASYRATKYLCDKGDCRAALFMFAFLANTRWAAPLAQCSPAFPGFRVAHLFLLQTGQKLQ